ncbi:MAG: acyl-CoA/acyl-ACP dehydrogenase [Bdellovibrionales bacterium]|nr:acyl-CoA/acyl-ACP dehydrogenase [Bdellovibrionales bacterium]
MVSRPNNQIEDHESAVVSAMRLAQGEDAAKEMMALEGAQRRADEKAKSSGIREVPILQDMVFGIRPDLKEFRPLQVTDRDKDLSSKMAKVFLDLKRKGMHLTTEGKISPQLRKALNEIGAYGVQIPKKYGGLEATLIAFAKAQEELSAHGGLSIALELSGHNAIGLPAPIMNFGSEAQKKYFLPLIAKQGIPSGFAATEVGVGTNITAVETRAEFDAKKGVYRLYGEKLWITNAALGNYVAFVAKDIEKEKLLISEAEKKGGSGKRVRAPLGVWVVKLPSENLPHPDKANEYQFFIEPSGTQAFRENDNAYMKINGLEVPAENKIENADLSALFFSLQLGRMLLGAKLTGHIRAMAAEVLNFASVRPAALTKGVIIDQELVQEDYADLEGYSHRTKCLYQFAITLFEKNHNLAALKDLIKIVSTEDANKAQKKAENIESGRSFNDGSLVDRHRNSVGVTPIVEGHNRILGLSEIKDISQRLINEYFGPLLGILEHSGITSAGKKRLTPAMFFEQKFRVISRNALVMTLKNKSVYKLAAWLGKMLAPVAFQNTFKKLIPTFALKRYKDFPPHVKSHLRFAEEGLTNLRAYILGFNLIYQLEALDRQVQTRMIANRLEKLGSILAICTQTNWRDTHEAKLGERELIRLKLETKALPGFTDIMFKSERYLDLTHQITEEARDGKSPLVNGIKPNPFPRDWRK